MEEMDLVWSPESALEAYIDTVKSCGNMQESSESELVSAMAAGWKASVIVETWCSGGEKATSIGLAVAKSHTGARHVCVVADEESSSEYKEAMEKSGQMAAEVIVGQAEAAIKALDGVEFMVVDCHLRDFTRMLKASKLSSRGAVLICKNASSATTSGFRWRSVLGWQCRIIRTVFLPVGNGLDIAYVGAASGGSINSISHWMKNGGPR